MLRSNVRAYRSATSSSPTAAISNAASERWTTDTTEIASEIATVGDEEVALRYALTLLRSTYSALDMISCHSS